MPTADSPSPRRRARISDPDRYRRRRVLRGKTIAEFQQDQEEALCAGVCRSDCGATEFCTVEPLMTHGKPWREVLRVAAEQQRDLIVIGVQGRGAADRLFFGSTTQHVVRDASCRVLTLRRG
jgi:nucleotide-binding universal stress UspA family protein